MSGFSANDVVQIDRVFGLSSNDEAIITTTFTHIPPVLAQTWAPTFTYGTFTKLKDAYRLKLLQCSPEVVDQVRILLTRYFTEIGATSVLKITRSAAGDEGVIRDDILERELIRQEISNLVSFTCPQGGFASECKRILRNIGSNLDGGR